MAYTEISRTEMSNETVVTQVKFDFMDRAIWIPHFRPQSEDDILLGISNREITEKKRLGLLPPDPTPEPVVLTE